MLEDLDINENTWIIFAGDFNIFFNSKLEAKGKSIAKLVEIKESLAIYDIWRIRNPKNQNFTFRQNSSTAFNCLQNFVNNTSKSRIC